MLILTNKVFVRSDKIRASNTKDGMIGAGCRLPARGSWPHASRKGTNDGRSDAAADAFGAARPVCGGGDSRNAPLRNRREDDV